MYTPGPIICFRPAHILVANPISGLKLEKYNNVKQKYVKNLCTYNFALMMCAQHQLEGFILPPTGGNVNNGEECIFLFNIASQFVSLQMTVLLYSTGSLAKYRIRVSIACKCLV